MSRGSCGKEVYGLHILRSICIRLSSCMYCRSNGNAMSLGGKRTRQSEYVRGSWSGVPKLEAMVYGNRTGVTDYIRLSWLE
jgi:hypothetical protein